MKKQPLVSIITITRNRANLIHRAINSILSQTYTNFEHIIIDGNSEDNTEEIVRSYSDERIKYIKLNINDIVHSINVGFNNSTGDFITFLDDDDEYLPSKIEKQLQLIQKLPETFGFVYCWMSYFDDYSGKFLHDHKSVLRGDVALDVIEKPVLSGTPTYFFRRAAFESLGGWRDDIGIISDWELAARACQKYYVDFVPESLIKVHVNHGNRRMSDPGFYKSLYPKLIRFHTYFLFEYKYAFEKYPKKKRYHLHNLVYSSLMLGNWRSGLKYYLELFKVSHSYRDLLLPLYCIIKKIK